jgi:Uma2 family endonuclease
MAMPIPATEWTLEMLHALPDDGNRYELVDGELLVSPSPSLPHQRVVAELLMLLKPWARERQLEAFIAPSAITFTPRRELQPDVFVVPYLAGRRVQDAGELVHLILAIEVLSPSTARHDRVTKRRVYAEQGVAEYWIVDPDARTVERWRPGDARPEVLTEMMEWAPPGVATALSIDLVELFRLALD